LIPLRDNQPTTTFPIVTILLIAANVLVYLVQQTLSQATVYSWCMIPFQIVHNQDIDPAIFHTGGQSISIGHSPHPLWITIFTSMFMHGSLMHIGGNMLFLWIFGNNIEDALGKSRFVFFYFACGLAASLAQIVSGPNSIIPTLGASGAIAGVLGAYYLLYPDAKVNTLFVVGFVFFLELKAAWVLALWIAIQVYQGVFGLGGDVAVFAHIGGFVAGLMLVNIWGGKKLVVKQRQRTYYAPPPSGGGYY
jgi:membrane associated rhomboid family serine protease